MNLHENKKLFADAVLAAAQHLSINPIFVEKDYWITRSLKLMAEADSDKQAIFKGGTSCSKAHRIGARFSEDIDVAIVGAASLNGNQRKMLIKRLAKAMTYGLEEIPAPGITSKGSNYYKAIYGYDRIPEIHDAVIGDNVPVRLGQIMVEINSFANPYPFVECEIGNFIQEFLNKTGNEGIISEYGLRAFRLNVLDRRRTATEKIVSLLRFSLADDYEIELPHKIRHFYDLHFLMEDSECAGYFHSDEFISDLTSLVNHDREMFDNPTGWASRTIAESPLCASLPALWESRLSAIYQTELSGLAYREIPDESAVLANVSKIFGIIKESGIL